MPTPPVATASPPPVSPDSSQLFGNCWSCRAVTGGGLLMSAAYVFQAARNVMKQGGTTSVGTVAQITFAASESIVSVV